MVTEVGEIDTVGAASTLMVSPAEHAEADEESVTS